MEIVDALMCRRGSEIDEYPSVNSPRPMATLDALEAHVCNREIQLCDQTEFPSSYEVV